MHRQATRLVDDQQRGILIKDACGERLHQPDPGLGAARSATRTGGTRTWSPACRRWSGLARPLLTRTSPLRTMR